MQLSLLVFCGMRGTVPRVLGFGVLSLQHALDAYYAGLHDRAVQILEQLDGSDADVRRLLGSILAFGPDDNRVRRGMRLLQRLADVGDGGAAHNLAVALQMAPVEVRSGFPEPEHYFAVAVNTGFEGAVASDPLWWKKA